MIQYPMTTNIDPPVAPQPGFWCRRRDGKAFRQDAWPAGVGYCLGRDGFHRDVANGLAASDIFDCIAIIGPICEGCDCTDGRCEDEP